MQSTTYELKYCERCGSLRLRRTASAGTYCEPCGQMLVAFSLPAHAERAMSPKEAALDFLHQMQSGELNREKLGEEFSVFLTQDRVKAAAPRLKALGEPEKVEVERIDERGGMEVASIVFVFKTAKLHGLLYRTPDGKNQQLLFRKR